MEFSSYEGWRKRFFYSVPVATVISGLTYNHQVNRSPVIKAAKTLSSICQSRHDIDTFMNSRNVRSTYRYTQLLTRFRNAIQDGESSQEILSALSKVNRLKADGAITQHAITHSNLIKKLTENAKGFKQLLKTPAIFRPLGFSKESMEHLLQTKTPGQWIEAIFQIERSTIRSLPTEWYRDMAKYTHRLHKQKALTDALTLFSTITWIPYALMHLARHKKVRNA